MAGFSASRSSVSLAVRMTRTVLDATAEEFVRSSGLKSHPAKIVTITAILNTTAFFNMLTLSPLRRYAYPKTRYSATCLFDGLRSRTGSKLVAGLGMPRFGREARTGSSIRTRYLLTPGRNRFRRLQLGKSVFGRRSSTDGERMTAVANLFSHVLERLALRTAFLPRRDGSGRLAPVGYQLFALE